MVFLLSKAFSTSSKTTVSQPKSLVSYANSEADVSMYVDGAVTIDQAHEALRITVGRDQNKIERINGYTGQVVRQEVFPSNPEAFAAFLKSLDKAGFTKAVSKSVSTDERGYCPLRSRFIYTLQVDGADKIREWTSSCDIGNYTGTQSLTRQLFVNQIPYKIYRDVTSGMRMSLV